MIMGYWMENQLIMGIDEVGRGCLAGPVVAAGVVIDECHLENIWVDDSKKLSDKKRRKLSKEIIRLSRGWGIGIGSVAEIDSINILQASLLAMRRAHANCPVIATKVLVDGREDPGLKIETETIINGDAIEPIISCASIVAKVFRDDLMQAYAREFPGYGLERHMGYGTKIHIEALRKQGVTAIHRKSFKPVLQLVTL